MEEGQAEVIEEKIDELTRKLAICSTKFEQIQLNMDHYEKWYVGLLTKANETVEATRKFLAKFTDEDIAQLERIVNAVHGE